jgi:hypothetical protein
MQYEPITRPPIRDPDVMTRMAIAFDLFDTAVAMMHQNLRRRNPEASEEEIEAGVREWLQRRPSAEHLPWRPSRRFEE